MKMTLLRTIPTFKWNNWKDSGTPASGYIQDDGLAGHWGGSWWVSMGGLTGLSSSGRVYLKGE